MSGLFNNAQGVIIHNGTFVNNVMSRERQGPWDRLLSAASPSAFFNSGDQLDAPKCHPNTRVAILDELRDFALSQGDMALIKALWLNGPAGAGKSAIARSLCEEFHAANALLASYFFKQTDSSRNTHKSFVATITYQIYGAVPEPYRLLILAVIQDDPLIFTRSLTTQWESLITHPLHELFESNYFYTVGRRLIVIDGLDECSTAAAQVSILKEIQRISSAGSPFLFMIASRPEHDIQSFLSYSSWKSPGCLLYRLDLGASYKADKDIERFLVDKLREVCRDHPRKDNIPAGWPSADVIEELVYKASGLFIYASLAIEFIASTRHQPHKRLDMVLGLCPLKGGLPFAELDMLYDQILSSCQDVDLALEIISYTNISDSLDLEIFAIINSLDIDDCIAALCDLRSILSLKDFGGHAVYITHRSLVDYLDNSSRSGRYHRDQNVAVCRIAGQILRFTSDPQYFSGDESLRLLAPFILSMWLPTLIQNIHVSHYGFMSLSLQKWYEASQHCEMPPQEKILLFYNTFWDTFPTLIAGLKQLATTDYKYVYDYYRAQFRRLNAKLPDLSTPLYRLHTPLGTEVQDAISVTFMSYYPDFPMPHSYTKLMFWLRSHIPPPPTIYIDSGRGPVEHDIALLCIDLIRSKSASLTAEDACLVRDTLLALRWILPSANHSLELYSSCSPLLLYDWCNPLLSRHFHINPMPQLKYQALQVIPSDGLQEPDNIKNLQKPPETASEVLVEAMSYLEFYRRGCEQKLNF